jgi:hypothetical protein
MSETAANVTTDPAPVAMTFKDMVGDPALPPELVNNSHAPDQVLFAAVLCVPVLYLLLRRRFTGAVGRVLCAQVAAAAAVLPVGYVTLQQATNTGEFADTLGQLCGTYGIVYACIALGKNIRHLAARKKEPLTAALASGAWPFILAAAVFMLRTFSGSVGYIYAEWNNPRVDLSSEAVALAGSLVLAQLLVRAIPVLPLAIAFLLAAACLAAPGIFLALGVAALPGPWLALRFMEEFAPIRKQARWGWAVVPLAPVGAMALALLALSGIIGARAWFLAAVAAVGVLYRVPGTSSPRASLLWRRVKPVLCYGLPVCLAVYLLAMAPFVMPLFSTGGDQYEQQIAALRPLVALGSAKAELYTGMAWSAGMNRHRSSAEAMKWYHAAAAHGDSFAMRTIALAYARGDGVPKDLGEAAKWYEQAAEHGDNCAQVNLGAMYMEGSGGLKKDPETALRWFMRSAAQGQPGAYSALYDMYRTGAGIPQDDVEAYFWFLLWRQYRQGIGFGGGDAPEIRKRLSSYQLAGLRLRVADWDPRPEHLTSELVLWPF